MSSPYHLGSSLKKKKKNRNQEKEQWPHGENITLHQGSKPQEQDTDLINRD